MPAIKPRKTQNATHPVILSFCGEIVIGAGVLPEDADSKKSCKAHFGFIGAAEHQRRERSVKGASLDRPAQDQMMMAPAVVATSVEGEHQDQDVKALP